MGYDIFLEAETKKDEPPAVLKVVCCRPINTWDSIIHVVVLRPPRIDWSILGGFILSALEPYVSQGPPPLIHFNEITDSIGLCIHSKWECHIPYLYSSQSVQELDKILIHEDKASYDRLSRFPMVMIRGEEFNALIQKLKEGIKNKLISLGCTIYYDFNESVETRKEKLND